MIHNGQLVARMLGGLGNQLFIYAAARSLAESSGRELRLDTTSGFVRDRQYRREYLLMNYSIKALPAASSDCFVGLSGRIRRAILSRVTSSRFISEEISNARSSLQLVDPITTCYLQGHWQSEEYFSKHQNIIREELILRSPLSEATKSELRQIEAEPHSVALCMRSFREVPVSHGPYVVSVDFYLRAIARLSSELPHVKIFIFSDDPAWARRQLPVSADHTYVRPKPSNYGACEDLALMQACRHHIIGNGTLHWWGAWLGANDRQIVLAPADFANCNQRFFPSTWRLQ
jgi:hypothetical protein